jgi:uncharacterized protein
MENSTLNKIDKLQETVKLVDVYGNLLTKRQKLILDLYFSQDLSLLEISKELSISKAAISESIKKSISKLKNIDKKLNIIQKYNI